MLMTRVVEDSAERAEFEQAFKHSGVTCIFQNAGEECHGIRHVLKRLANYTWVIDRLPEVLRRAAAPSDIAAAKSSNKHCLYLSFNAIPIVEQWQSAREELAMIEYFFRLGCRMMHLTYNRRNMFGDGCAETSNAGLSDFGRQAIAEMNRVGVLVDVAHSGQRTSLEAAKASGQPVVVSHSAVMELNQHCRCKTDEVIRAVADSGGYMGICCLGVFLGRSADLQALLDHIDHVAKKFGTRHVAIGTDTAYESANSAREMEKAGPFPKQRPRFDSFWPPNDPLFDKHCQQPEKVKSVSFTNWPLFTVGLVQRGYKDDEIQQIIGGNTLRVTEQVFRAVRGRGYENSAKTA
jgi:membrane dipeptidase